MTKRQNNSYKVLEARKETSSKLLNRSEKVVAVT